MLWKFPDPEEVSPRDDRVVIQMVMPSGTRFIDLADSTEFPIATREELKKFTNGKTSSNFPKDLGASLALQGCGATSIQGLWIRSQEKICREFRDFIIQETDIEAARYDWTISQRFPTRFVSRPNVAFSVFSEKIAISDRTLSFSKNSVGDSAHRDQKILLQQIFDFARFNNGKIVGDLDPYPSLRGLIPAVLTERWMENHLMGCTSAMTPVPPEDRVHQYR